jgi:DNA-binding response OmpR family regulator
MGADDCVARPFSVRELVSRIDAVARRSGPATAPGPAHTLRIGALAIDRPARRVAWHNAELRLTRKEFDLLTMLAENAGTVCVRERILAEVWDENWYGSSRTLDVHIGSLRRKLGRECPIETVRGVGFRLSS